jgi:hypothetical protein
MISKIMWNNRKKGGTLRLLVAKEDEIIYLIIAIKYSLLVLSQLIAIGGNYFY